MPGSMLSIGDSRFRGLRGVYGIYDPLPDVEALNEGDAGALQRLWENLVHQGEAYEASYVAVPFLVEAAKTINRDSHYYALLASIELYRAKNDVILQEWLSPLYRSALEGIASVVLGDLLSETDPVAIRIELALIAVIKRDIRRASMLLEFTDDELDEVLGR